MMLDKKARTNRIKIAIVLFIFLIVCMTPLFVETKNIKNEWCHFLDIAGDGIEEEVCTNKDGRIVENQKAMFSVKSELKDISTTISKEKNVIDAKTQCRKYCTDLSSGIFSDWHNSDYCNQMFAVDRNKNSIIDMTKTIEYYNCWSPEIDVLCSVKYKGLECTELMCLQECCDYGCRSEFEDNSYPTTCSKYSNEKNCLEDMQCVWEQMKWSVEVNKCV